MATHKWVKCNLRSAGKQYCKCMEKAKQKYSTLSVFVFDYFLFASEIKQAFAVDSRKMQKTSLFKDDS